MTVHYKLHNLIFVQFNIVQVVIINVNFLAGVRSISHLYFNQAILAVKIHCLIQHLIIAIIYIWIHIGLRLVKHD